MQFVIDPQAEHDPYGQARRNGRSHHRERGHPRKVRAIRTFLFGSTVPPGCSLIATRAPGDSLGDSSGASCLPTRRPSRGLRACAICALWGIYGGIYFLRSSKAKAKPLLVTEKRPATQVAVKPRIP